MRLFLLSATFLPLFMFCGKTVYYHDTHPVGYVTVTPVQTATPNLPKTSPNETNVNLPAPTVAPTATPVVECYSACHGKPKGTVVPTPKPTVKPTTKPTPVKTPTPAPTYKPTPKPTPKPYY